MHIVQAAPFDIPVEQEPPDSAEAVDYGLRVDASRVVALDEPVQNVVDVLNIDIGNLPLFAELAELS